MTSIEPRRGRGFLRPFLALSALGLLGIATLPILVRPIIERMLGAAARAPGMSPEMLVALSMVQPTVLMLLAVATGVLLAPRVGFRSHAADRAAGVRSPRGTLLADLGRGGIAGAVGGLVVALADLRLAPTLGPAAEQLAISQPRTLGTTLAGMLYGGITEELLLRWGLLTLVAWAIWRVRGRPASLGAPSLWAATAFAALLFAAGHLPATAALVPLTTVVVARALVLNGVLGVL